MKNRYSAVLAILMMLGLLIVFTANVNASPSVMISSYELTPSVLMPGDTALLTLTVYNAETTYTKTTQTTSGITTTTTAQTVSGIIENIWVTTASDGDNEIRASSNYDDVGAIAPGGSIPISFRMTADENISQGWYFPKVRINLEVASHQDVSYPITIRISNETVELIDSEVPSTIYLSGATEVTLSVVNNFEASVDAVTVEPVEVSGIDVSPKRIFVGEMDSDSYEDVSFSVTPTTEGEFNLSFIVKYKNGENTHSSTLDFAIEVVDSLDVAPVIYSVPSTVGKGESGRIRLEVYNAKGETISGVIVSPINTNLSVSPSQYFIGSMDSDDVYSASFEIDTADLEIGQAYSIDFRVSFKQGESYYETPSVNAGFTVVEPTLTDNGMSTCYTTIIVIVVAIIAIVLFFFYRKRRKDK